MLQIMVFLKSIPQFEMSLFDEANKPTHMIAQKIKQNTVNSYLQV